MKRTAWPKTALLVTGLLALSCSSGLEVVTKLEKQTDARIQELKERIDKLESSAFTFGQIHRVKEGESVASIARKYGVTPEAIVEANDLSDANLINVGQELLIPGVSE